jgi:hypothetical protein
VSEMGVNTEPPLIKVVPWLHRTPLTHIFPLNLANYGGASILYATRNSAGNSKKKLYLKYCTRFYIYSISEMTSDWPL